MSTTYKVVFSSLFFIIVCSLSIFSIILPAFQYDSIYNDIATRKELSGKIEFCAVGASHMLGGFIPDILDKKLNACSYNLSSYTASLIGRSTLLKKVEEKNPIKTVIIDISHDTFFRDAKHDNGTGEAMILCKLDSNVERLKYIMKNISFIQRDYENILSILIHYGLKSWSKKIKGQTEVIKKSKGYISNPVSNVVLKKNLKTLLNCEKINTNYPEQNILIVSEMIHNSQLKGELIILVVVPVSESWLWKNSNMDDFRKFCLDFASKNNCLLIDFNLLKNRQLFFNDENSFCNETHLGNNGAECFTSLLAKYIYKINSGEDIKNDFYQSYIEAKHNSIYKQ